MPSVNIQDPFSEDAYREDGSDRTPAVRRALILARVPWLVLLGGVLALAALLKG